MARVNPFAPDIVRIRIFSFLMAAFIAGLCVVLWEMQVGDGLKHKDTIEKQSVRRVALPGMRGLILDRSGKVLADNAPDYCIAVYIEELRRFGSGTTLEKAVKLIDLISKIIEKPPEIGQKEIAIHLSKRKPLPLLAWTSVNDADIAKLAEFDEPLPGVDIYVRPNRRYPQGSLAAHLLGYVGRSDPEEKNGLRYHYYLPDMVGRRGLEKRFDSLLKGVNGGELMRVDVSGYKFERISASNPMAGGDLKAAIDSGIQRIAENALSNAVGAVVILDPRNGDVLALASSPGYDPNMFSPVLPASLWNELIADEDKPLVFRAVSGAYPPGSVFKPIVALGSAAAGQLDADTTVRCAGSINLGKARFNCYHGIAHGEIGLEKAIEVSCNVFFYQIALRAGYESVLDMAADFGLGRQTGIELEFESAGLLPSSEWKQRNRGDIWRDGDTCNLAIGQGFLLVTPLQMAVVAATIANGGLVYEPRLALAVRDKSKTDFEVIPPSVRRQIHFRANSLDMVRAGMRRAVQSPHGTGRRASVPGVEMAGKTGTAQYGRNREKSYAWMILFAPFEEPRYAVAMIIEDGVSGGSTAAPRVGQIMSELFRSGTGGG